MSRKDNVWEHPPSVRSLPWHFIICLSIATAVVALCTALSQGQSGAPKLAENLPSGAMQQKATTACTECHEARIILQQRLSKAAWTKEVDKMIKWGAVVDSVDHDALVDYLSTNFSVDQPAYQPPRSSPVANNKAQSK